MNQITCVFCQQEKSIESFTDKTNGKVYKNCEECRKYRNEQNRKSSKLLKEKYEKAKINKDNIICFYCHKEKESKYFIVNNKICKKCDKCRKKERERERELNKKILENMNPMCSCDEKVCEYCKSIKPNKDFINNNNVECKTCISCRQLASQSYKEKKKIIVSKFINNKDDAIRICLHCGSEKPIENFKYRNKIYNNCINCRNTMAKHKRNKRIKFPEREQIHKQKYLQNDNTMDLVDKIHFINNLEYLIYKRAKWSALDRNLEFSITPEYIKSLIPIDNKCPILNEEFVWFDSRNNLSISIDRIDSTLGYVEGNIQIISLIANIIKNNLTLSELERFIYNYNSATKNLIQHPIDDITRQIIIQERLTQINDEKILNKCSKRREREIINTEHIMSHHCSRRAFNSNMDCNIDADYIKSIWQLDNCCPVFGTKYKTGHGKATLQSPSLDRIDNSLGYIKGNVLVVSRKANFIKSKYSLEELNHVITCFRNYYDRTGTGIIL